jgi:starvation-inducible DNA-binding protein
VQRDALNILLADMFTLYLKTKNFHWHLSGPHFRDYHLMLDEQGEHIFATTDDIAERVRKIGGTTIRSYRASMSATGCVDLNSPCGLACRT